MKKIFFCLFTVVSLYSCSKDPQADNTQSDPNNNNNNNNQVQGSSIPIPAPSSISSKIIGRITDQYNMPLNFNGYSINGVGYSSNNTTGIFEVGPIQVDQYSNLLHNGNLIDNQRDYNFTTTNTIANYIKVRNPARTDIGTVAINTGGTFSATSGASIQFDPNSLYTINGSFDANASADVSVFYSNPLDPEFALNLPCYSFADISNQRWFLKSFGLADLRVQPYNSYAPMDFYNGATGKLKVPIQSSMLLAAPDSISAWHLENGIWVKKATAQKVNGYYEANIPTVGAWNFAVAVPGNYKTIKFRTDNNTPVVGATIRVKADNFSSFENKTNSDGNMLCFIPVSNNISVDAVIDQAYAPTTGSQVVYSQNISSPSSTDYDVTIPVTSQDLFSIHGTGTACGAGGITNGYVRITKEGYQDFNYYVPLINGQFKMALLWGNNSTTTIWAKTYDISANQTGLDTSVFLVAGQDISFNLNTCQQTNLFVHYSIDNINYAIDGNLSSQNIIGNYYFGNAKTSISASEGNNVFAFTTDYYGVGTGSDIFDGIALNSDFYLSSEFGFPSNVTFTRYDAVGGIIEGSVEFYVRDASMVLHHATATFRVKRLT